MEQTQVKNEMENMRIEDGANLVKISINIGFELSSIHLVVNREQQ